jgi:glycosyltransferase involved in cell wall biosynthesis
VLPEAMASGLAVVAYDYAAACQMVRQGDNGLLVPFGDTAAFSAAALRLAGQLGWVRAMGLRGRLAAQGHDWSAIVAQVEQAYLDAMAGPPRHHSSSHRPPTPLPTSSPRATIAARTSKPQA